MGGLLPNTWTLVPCVVSYVFLPLLEPFVVYQVPGQKGVRQQAVTDQRQNGLPYSQVLAQPDKLHLSVKRYGMTHLAGEPSFFFCFFFKPLRSLKGCARDIGRRLLHETKYCL